MTTHIKEKSTHKESAASPQADRTAQDQPRSLPFVTLWQDETTSLCLEGTF